MNFEDNQSSQGTSQSDDMLHSNEEPDISLFKTKEEDSDTPDEESETYYFESDHLALKGNHDYQMMLRAIATLEAQRIQAVKDLDRLYEGQKEALADPIQFVERLQRGQNLKLPKPQKVIHLPDIRWEKYTSNLDFSSFGTHRHMTRLKKQLKEGNVDESKIEKTESEDIVRSRVKTEKKSDTFNLPWTPEEQKRLEELLIQYPPEEVEARRFQKIAASLGNRTPLQVQSRVQKYFIKLANAGLPIPGRIPNMTLYKRKNQRGQRHHRMYNQSTFLTSVVPPVYMSDDDENSQSYEGSITSEYCDFREENVSDDESIPVQLRTGPEYQELLHLKRLRKEKLGFKNTSSEHIGFKCDGCNMEPIVGIRWHCTDCPPDIAVDFCEQCVDSGYETENHNSSHRLKPKMVTDSSSYMDTDYMSFVPGDTCTGYNYLDPNYMPAS